MVRAGTVVLVGEDRVGGVLVPPVACHILLAGIVFNHSEEEYVI